MLVMVLNTFTACSKKENTAAATSTTSSIILQGQWRITYFNNSGADSSAAYNGFKLLFTSGGSVAAFNDLFAVNGSWNTYNNDSRDNLFLHFPTTLLLISALNDDWHIVEKTSVKIRMQDVTAAGGQTHYLTIEKI
jgi:hypothetical protein